MGEALRSSDGGPLGVGRGDGGGGGGLRGGEGLGGQQGSLHALRAHDSRRGTSSGEERKEIPVRIRHAEQSL